MELGLLLQVLRDLKIARYLKTIDKLWDLAALELKFRFSYAKHFTCSQIDVKYNKTLHFL